MRIVLRGEGTEEHRLAGHQRVGVLVERQAPKRGGLHAEAREDGTAGTIGSEQSRAGLKWECCAAGVCDSGHQVATAGTIHGVYGATVALWIFRRSAHHARMCGAACEGHFGLVPVCMSHILCGICPARASVTRGLATTVSSAIDHIGQVWLQAHVVWN